MAELSITLKKLSLVGANAKTGSAFCHIQSKQVSFPIKSGPFLSRLSMEEGFWCSGKREKDKLLSKSVLLEKVITLMPF